MRIKKIWAGGCGLVIILTCILNLKFCDELVHIKNDVKQVITNKVRYSEDLNYLDGEVAESGFYKEENLIAHGGGGVNGFTYTNSLESIKKAMERYDYIEVDLLCTSDNHVVLKHNWEGETLSYSEFMSQKIYGYFTPIDLKTLLELAAGSEKKFILDPRFADKNQIETFFEELEFYCSTEYVEKNLAIIINDISILQSPGDEININWIYRLGLNDKLSDVIALCIQNSIEAICIDPSYIDNPEQLNCFVKFNIKCLIYKTNDPKTAMRYWEHGVKCIFTDFIVKEDLEELSLLKEQ